jgi:DNA replication protein DnaC
MLTHPTLDKLRSLRLTGMANALQDQLSQPNIDLDFESRLGLLVEQEWLLRENNRLKRRLTQAKLQQHACMEDIDFKHPRELNKAAFLEILGGNWIKQRLNLLITAPTGCGKTYLSCAVAHKACLMGFTSRYYRLPRLWQELKVAKADGSYISLLNQLAKVNVLILDDWGLAAPQEEQRRDLLEILEDRYQKQSTIITSQLPIAQWHEHLNDATLADAILDRLLHNAIRLELKGDSLRKIKKTLQTQGT